MPRSRQRRSLRTELGLEIAAFVFLVACASLLWRDNGLLLLVAAGICGFALERWHTRFDVCLFLVIAVLGSAAEAVFVYSGVREYANPTLLGVPIWFPLAFGTTGLISGRLARTLSAIWDNSIASDGSSE